MHVDLYRTLTYWPIRKAIDIAIYDASILNEELESAGYKFQNVVATSSSGWVKSYDHTDYQSIIASLKWLQDKGAHIRILLSERDECSKLADIANDYFRFIFKLTRKRHLTRWDEIKKALAGIKLCFVRCYLKNPEKKPSKEMFMF